MPRVVVAPAGGRISALVDKASGSDLVALWKGAGEIGGLLDDRNVFTSMPYRVTAVEAEGTALQLSVESGTGLRLEKTISLRRNGSVVEVRYTLSNGSQRAAPLWIRSFPVPGGPLCRRRER